MKIKITIACSGMGFLFSPGQECDVDDALAKDLINAGYAETAKKTVRSKGNDA